MENNAPDRIGAQRMVVDPPTDADVDRRKFLLQAARALAGTVGGLALCSLARIDSAAGLEDPQSGTQKSIRRKAERELVKYFRSRSKAREAMSTAQAKEQESAQAGNCTCGCGCGCTEKCNCTCPPETFVSTGLSQVNSTYNVTGPGVGNSKAADQDPNLPGVSGPALGAGIAALSAAAAWMLLKRRAAETSREA
jgi:hypothetical protein